MFLDRTEKVFGPPGTGKTTYLLDTLERELRNGVKPERIGFVTFTTAARSEALARIHEKFGLTQKELPHFRTLHSAAYQALGVTSQMLVKGPKELKPLADMLHVEFKGKWVDVDEVPYPSFGIGNGDALLQFDHFRRHNLMSVEQAFKKWDGEASFYEVKRFCDTYYAWRQKEGYMDFTDLLEGVYEPLPVEVMIVDESQDLSKLQWRALDIFATDAARVYLAGDDDQAIFAWAGADAEAFITRPGRVHVLHQSYRLPRRVFELADRIVRNIRVRQPKIWHPRNENGSVSRLIDPRHVDFGRDGKYLVLYRNHYQGKHFEAHLRELGLPYSRSDKPAPGAQWAEAITKWERLRKGIGLTAQEVETIYDSMTTQSVARGAKKLVNAEPEGRMFMLNDLESDFGLLTRAPWYEALTKIEKEEVMYLRRLIKNHGPKILTSEAQIKMSTIHAAKGGQADNVVLLTDMSSQTRASFDRNPDTERRVFYVGVTRAITHLTLVGTENPIL
jgi:DNA helicase-2/ATP-dependent DNA helicase PcrA